MFSRTLTRKSQYVMKWTQINSEVKPPVDCKFSVFEEPGMARNLIRIERLDGSRRKYNKQSDWLISFTARVSVFTLDMKENTKIKGSCN